MALARELDALAAHQDTVLVLIGDGELFVFFIEHNAIPGRRGDGQHLLLIIELELELLARGDVLVL